MKTERKEKEKSVVLREPTVRVIITDGTFAYQIIICQLSCLEP